MYDIGLVVHLIFSHESDCKKCLLCNYLWNININNININEILISPGLNSLLSTECQGLICLIMQENHSNNVNDGNFPFSNWIIFGGGEK